MAAKDARALRDGEHGCQGLRTSWERERIVERVEWGQKKHRESESTHESLTRTSRTAPLVRRPRGGAGSKAAPLDLLVEAKPGLHVLRRHLSLANVEERVFITDTIKSLASCPGLSHTHTNSLRAHTSYHEHAHERTHTSTHTITRTRREHSASGLRRRRARPSARGADRPGTGPAPGDARRPSTRSGGCTDASACPRAR